MPFSLNPKKWFKKRQQYPPKPQQKRSKASVHSIERKQRPANEVPDGFYEISEDAVSTRTKPADEPVRYDPAIHKPVVSAEERARQERAASQDLGQSRQSDDFSRESGRSSSYSTTTTAGEDSSTKSGSGTSRYGSDDGPSSSSFSSSSDTSSSGCD